jgi:hypothetical protein
VGVEDVAQVFFDRVMGDVVTLAGHVVVRAQLRIVPHAAGNRTDGVVHAVLLFEYDEPFAPRGGRLALEHLEERAALAGDAVA